MVEIYTVSLIKGLMFGIEYEDYEGNEYIIINMGLVSIIFTW